MKKEEETPAFTLMLWCFIIPDGLPPSSSCSPLRLFDVGSRGAGKGRTGGRGAEVQGRTSC